MLNRILLCSGRCSAMIRQDQLRIGKNPAQTNRRCDKLRP